MSEHLCLIRIKVYDPVLRLLHAWNGLAALLLFVSGQLSSRAEPGAASNELWHFHMRLGYALAAGLLARLIWGFTGPRQARLTELWHPRAWIGFAQRRKEWKGPRPGHDPLASLAYLGVYALFFFQIASGFVLAAVEHARGPLAPALFDQLSWTALLMEPHELASSFLAAFVLLHLGALIVHEKREKRPLAQSMVSGFQYFPETQTLERKNNS